ncbi:TetR/AcrR family transcriptional regulator [Streptomyces sp. SBT349]|uniref:TetR/AcrR family transcriptional regulator n=1 Tax=Streptomyces sp. SBT349 TaxID=1580539 RepID=UPI00066D888E|nr:TetR/AcrR family transcriptional regulator [Streptomyces sp. SBT349]
MAEPVAALRADGHTDWRTYEPLELPPILAAALAAFGEQGYHGTSVRVIARRVGVTVPTLYYHHRNKQALLAELLTGSLRAALGRCRSAVEGAGPEPVARFSALVECLVLYAAHRAPLAALDAEARSLEPENLARYAAERDELKAMLHRAVQDGADLGDFTTAYPVDAGRAVLTMCVSVADWYRPEGPLTPEALARRYVGIALASVGHRTRRRAR